MENKSTPSRWTLWFGLVLANIVGWVVGMPLSCGLSFYVSGFFFATWDDWGIVAVGGLFGATLGAVLATMQWVIMRQMKRKDFSAGTWVTASIMGGAVAWAAIWISLLIRGLSSGMD